MNKFLLFFIAFHLYSYSQNKVMVPKRGTIVFSKEQIITDTIAYRKSTALLSEKMFEFEKASIKKERQEQELEVDSVTLNNIILKLKNEVKGNLYLELYGDSVGVYRFCNTFNNDEIYYRCTLDNQLIGDTLIYKISRTRNSNDREIKIINHLYSDINIVSINEFKNEIKKINGYVCFKVELSFIESFENNDINCFMNDLIQHKELWVTDKIKSPVHPVFHINNILEKYYPLEIIESTEGVEGFKVVYRLEKLNIH